MSDDSRPNCIRKKQKIISFLMLLCFAVSYLPVTNSWYLAVKGREDLTRLVASVVRAKIDIVQKKSDHAVKQTMDSMFKELKIAAGIIQGDVPPEKSKISLVEIVPEFPVQPALFRLRMDKKKLYGLSDHEKYYQSVTFLLDPPPPENWFV